MHGRETSILILNPTDTQIFFEKLNFEKRRKPNQIFELLR